MAWMEMKDKNNKFKFFLVKIEEYSLLCGFSFMIFFLRFLFVNPAFQFIWMRFGVSWQSLCYIPRNSNKFISVSSHYDIIVFIKALLLYISISLQSNIVSLMNWIINVKIMLTILGYWKRVKIVKMLMQKGSTCLYLCKTWWFYIPIIPSQKCVTR